MRKLSVRMGRLSRRFWALLVLAAVIVVSASAAWGYAHHTSKGQFAEHSPAVFEAARREGKPVFLLISAVWCYWCKHFDQQVLQEAEVARYLNRHYVSVFADHDRRPDLVRRYLRGLPMVVLFGADGRVRQSFAGVLEKEDFLSVVRNVAASPPPATESRPVATPAAGPVTPDGYGRLTEGVLSFVQENLDAVYGGFGTGDNHPQPRLLAYLLERHEATGDRRYLTAVKKTLRCSRSASLRRGRRPGGRPDYLDGVRRILSTLGEPVRELPVESDDALVRVGDAAYYLRAYARMVGEPRVEERR